ncbi:uncharacterized protein LOC6562782 [Drosophila grimshawi]|uniref:GH10613 n=1 Tax=Drosophila grimshawi TaxID=7222 RepID=B4JCY2_DROGR|nr:uncharacterized protein LOC6562782 [Drosophila grimshawi]EDW03221.1 GH10613 [Drosophila grimshawi]
MLLKYFPIILLLAQSLLAASAPAGVANAQPRARTQKQLEEEAHNETISLLNALFREQIAYFSGVREKLEPTTKRAQDIELYVSRLNVAIAENDLDRKDAIWLSIFEQFNKSPLLLNKQEETGLNDSDYQALLTDKKLQEITQNFVRDVSTYFWKIAQLSGKVLENSIDQYMANPK